MATASNIAVSSQQGIRQSDYNALNSDIGSNNVGVISMNVTGSKSNTTTQGLIAASKWGGFGAGQGGDSNMTNLSISARTNNQPVSIVSTYTFGTDALQAAVAGDSDNPVVQGLGVASPWLIIGVLAIGAFMLSMFLKGRH